MYYVLQKNSNKWDKQLKPYLTIQDQLSLNKNTLLEIIKLLFHKHEKTKFEK